MSQTIRPIKKLLVANRGEIAIRVFRAATELKIRTVAIFTYEDRYSLHRYKADEAYSIGKRDEPLKPYLDIEEIINIALKHKVDAIHPGYGFLSENVNFARRCQQEGIIFIGPAPEVMEQLGDKIQAKKIAQIAAVPLIEDNELPLENFENVEKEALRIGFPVVIKASAGGGGRGMRVVRSIEALAQSYQEARNEANIAFGDDTVFMEKFIDRPKHIEVQIVADQYGNMVHLFERDCSVQRRFQKLVEIAPSVGLREQTRQEIYKYALAICQKVQYSNVGTVEFLVDASQKIYFIEVNPRIQVEHTITEEITGVDIVRTQILIAQGYRLDSPKIELNSQQHVELNGFAIQCRVTTEDPTNDFRPDYGTINAYRNGAGFGIRLDAGSAYNGAKISPFFDSLLVKVSSWGRTLEDASSRLQRALMEFRIRGVKTNIDFLIKVIAHPDFISGKATVAFLTENPDLFDLPIRLNRANKVIKYLADVTVNGNPDVKFIDPHKKFRFPQVPEFKKHVRFPVGTKDKLTEWGRDKFLEWIKNEKVIHYTDTTFRDAHQSLLATRMRGLDLARIAESYAKNFPQVFSAEVWGGATFDVCLRFLHEDPWERLQEARRRMPNILLQMLLRGSNAVGYKAYPDNLIEKFIEKSGENGVDIFRIFDSLNWVENMKRSIRAVREYTGGLAEASISYTGNILDPASKKYTLQYYLDLAKQLEDEGAHLLAIKDMAGLLKPYAAELLVTKLKETVHIPIHLHTHDTASIQSATYLKAIEAGVDIIDVAIASMSGLTSQPNFNAIVAMLEGHTRENPFDLQKLNEFSTYWEDVREYYYPFESGLKAGTAEVYEHEIPGGQYSNLRPQAESLGLGDQFEKIKKNYTLANKMFGDIVKVTPSSKVVGDFALFLTSQNLTEEDIMTKGHQLSFPESVINFFKGDLGQPYGGFPEQLQRIILKEERPISHRSSEGLEPIDFEQEWESFQEKFGKEYRFEDVLSYLLYPKVFEEYHQFRQSFGYVNFIPTPAFFFGLKVGEEILIRLDVGKTLILKLVYISEPDQEGQRTVNFELNGQVRQVLVRDKKAQVKKEIFKKATTPKEIGAPMPGKLGKVLVGAGQKIQENTPLFIMEAMKMETTVVATTAGKIKKLHLEPGTLVQAEDLIIELE